MFNNAWVYDIEIFPNLFTLIARKLDSKEYETFVIHESQDDSVELKEWMGTRPRLIGYNSIDFDGQIIEYIHRSADFTVEGIYNFVLSLPLNDKTKSRFDLPYSEWDLSYKPVDLFKINHFDNKKTSLKWLEFTTRWSKLKDMPIAPHKEVPKSKIKDILRYNKNDVDITYDFYYRCLPMIELRVELAKKFKQGRIVNMSDSSLGAFIFEHILTNDYGIKKKQLKEGTHHDKIYGKDILLPYINFENPEFQEIHMNFKNQIYSNEDGGKLTDVSGSQYEQTTMFQDMVFVFGSGGLHSCYKAGEFTPAEDEYLLSVDVASYYPNLAIMNNFFPMHIGDKFPTIYKEVYDTRKTYEKGTPLNYAYKIALNGVYGKSNSVYSIFYDLAYLLKIVVNGQLLLAMLAEQLSKFGRLLMVNTDGMEIIIKKKDLNEVQELCGAWEALTGLELEHTEYKKMVIRDVNNYIAIDSEDKPKRKGMFEIYYDITEEDGKPHFYNKTPNASIIPEALFNYYAKDTPIQETIDSSNNIHDFCFGIKKQKKFEYWLITAQPNGVIDIDKRDDKVLRYFISKDGANIYKFWKDDRKNNIQGVNRGQLVSLAMNTTNTDIERIKTTGTIKAGTKKSELVVQYPVDREYYVKEAEKIMDIINSGTRDNPYKKYIKQLESLETSNQ